MGPQLYRCGNGKRSCIHMHEMQTSMGPQLYRCGNLRDRFGEQGQDFVLQWGRNFIVAETKVKTSIS